MKIINVTVNNIVKGLNITRIKRLLWSCVKTAIALYFPSTQWRGEFEMYYTSRPSFPVF